MNAEVVRGVAARVIMAVALLGGCGTTIGPGRVGVLWRASGGTQAETYPEGRCYVAPWNDLSIYDLRSMSHDEVLTVIAVNGLSIKLDASVRYHLEPGDPPGIYDLAKFTPKTA
jgi:hypothetical protein